jgi:hypothetical protein
VSGAKKEKKNSKIWKSSNGVREDQRKRSLQVNGKTWK